MVQRPTIRASGARDRGSNPRRPITCRDRPARSGASLLRRSPVRGNLRFESGSRRRGPVRRADGRPRSAGTESRPASGPTSRLTAGGVPLAAKGPCWNHGVHADVDSGVRIALPPLRRSIRADEGAWSNGKTPASRAGDGRSTRSVPSYRGSQAANGDGLRTRDTGLRGFESLPRYPDAADPRRRPASGLSLSGRAPPWHGGGRRFESDQLHSHRPVRWTHSQPPLTASGPDRQTADSGRCSRHDPDGGRVERGSYSVPATSWNDRPRAS